MAAPQINVYALLPQSVVLGTGLSLCRTDWYWVHCLSLPLEEFNNLRLSQRPYKWIRYAIGVVVGAEGTLSTSCNPHDIVDYDTASLLAGSADLYYHTSEEERERVFPVDPHILRTHTTSSPTTRRETFLDEVAERDGGRCVLTGAHPDSCDATHLVTHSKGDEYIATYTQHRSRDANGGDIIREIDSTRNGLFLNKIAYGRLGRDLAFLVTPNFALNTADIVLDADPAEWRCTSHFFQPSTPFLAVVVPSGSPLRIFPTPEYPPTILFDIAYAGTVLHHFGTPAVKDGLNTAWDNIVYPTRVSRQGDSDEISQKLRNKKARKIARDEPDPIDMVTFLPFIMVPPDELEAVMRELGERAEVAERERTEEKVKEWMKTVNSG